MQSLSNADTLFINTTSTTSLKFSKNSSKTKKNPAAEFLTRMFSRKTCACLKPNKGGLLESSFLWRGVPFFLLDILGRTNLGSTQLYAIVNYSIWSR